MIVWLSIYYPNCWVSLEFFGESLIQSCVDCTLLKLSSISEGTVTNKSMDDIILVEPKIKNGRLKPPTLYNHAPTAGPAIYIWANYNNEVYHENIFNYIIGPTLV